MTNPQPGVNKFYLDLGRVSTQQAATLEQVGTRVRLPVARRLEVIKYAVKHRLGNFYRVDHWCLLYKNDAGRVSFL